MTPEDRAKFEAIGLTERERLNEERKRKVNRMIDEGWICVPPDAIRQAQREVLNDVVEIIHRGHYKEDSPEELVSHVRALASGGINRQAILWLAQRVVDSRQPLPDKHYDLDMAIDDLARALATQASTDNPSGEGV